MLILEIKQSINSMKYAGRMPCDDTGRDWSDTAVSQGIPRTDSDHKKRLEESQKEPTLPTL